jgi:hypothetical protein
MNKETEGTNQQVKLFLVDDDALFLKSLEIEFMQHADFIIETFAPALVRVFTNQGGRI